MPIWSSRRGRLCCSVAAGLVALTGGVGGWAAAAGGAPSAPSPAWGDVGQTVTSGTNLLPADQASLSGGGTGGWTGLTNAGLTVTPDAQSGADALQVTAVGAGDVWIGSGGGPGTWTSAQAGLRYTGQLWVRAGQTGRDVDTTLAFRSASGTVVGFVWGESLTDTTSWQETPPVTALAPAGTAWVQLDVLVSGAAAGESHYIENARLVAAATGAPAVAGPLHVVGNTILDAHGLPVVLRGVVVDGLENDPTDPVTLAALQAVKSWGANVIRLPVNDRMWINTDCNYDPGYVSEIDQVVNWVTSLGMVALLDLHDDSIQACDPVPSGGRHDMADYPDAVTFWSQVAARYRSNPLVAFDLYNEPHDISQTIWLTGGQVTENGITYRAAGMQQMYDAIRATGDDNLVIVEGPGWAGSPPSTLVAGDNIVYSLHAYTCPTASMSSCGPDPDDPTPILDQFLPLGASHPILIGEFGWPDPSSGGDYTANVVDFADQHGWSWTAFAWQDSFESAVWSLNSINNWQPTPTGQGVVAGLVAGNLHAPGR